ncbi:hypothetical protein [Alloscardovia criceti]|uniref:hypothetical protein n=1 Tax=Alloscardovia criceti TaxID=356828 RepID=UPI00039C3CD4|nr:hypothetical protein [Alloscardovia criceti]
MLKKLYDKNELHFALVWIIVYCVAESLAFDVNASLGVEYLANAIVGLVLTGIALVFLIRHRLTQRFGLTSSTFGARRFLWYIPLIVIASGNLWNGLEIRYSWAGMVSSMVSMLCIGFFGGAHFPWISL